MTSDQYARPQLRYAFIVGGLVAGVLVLLPQTVASASPPNQTDRFFAGYLTSPTARPTTVSSQLRVPTLDCSGVSSTLDVFPGVDLRSSGGAIATVAGIGLRCTGTTASYSAQVDFGSSTVVLPMTITPGDAVILSVSSSPTGSSGTVEDVTSGGTQSASGAGFKAKGGAKIGIFSTFIGGSEVGVPPFGTMTFKHVQVGNVSLGTANPTGVDRVNGVTLQIRTRPIVAIGTKFKMSFVHS